ncbi:tetratricopeptide repeat protein [Patescibacteria group bacterium]|nr:tetratricopeptide repeat protein [Patescibacteria group bacterium]
MEEQELIEQKAIKCALDGHFEQAIGYNLELLKRNIKSVSVYNRLGRACLELKKWEEAEKYYSLALEIDSVNQTAIKGLEMSKNKKAHALPNVSHKELILSDLSTSFILDIQLTKVKLNEVFIFRISKSKKYYFIKNAQEKTLKQIAKSRLNLKSQIIPFEINGKVIEILNNDIVRIKLSSSEPIFKGSKQEINPSLDTETKEVMAEKRELAKILLEEREED